MQLKFNMTLHYKKEGEENQRLSFNLCFNTNNHVCDTKCSRYICGNRYNQN